jgi:uncharacterized membrane protein HdeD (DUF308 family)
MSWQPSGAPGDVPRDGLDVLRGMWGWFLVLGIALVITGMVAISFAFVATLATMIAFGVVLLVAGAFQLIGAVVGRRWGGFFLHLLAGVLYFVVGLAMIERPVGAAAAVTLVLAVAYVIGGVVRIVVALANRFGGWIWVLLNGVITLVLGILIWAGWPTDSLWIIGLFVGIDLLFAGWTWVTLALAVK